MRIFKLIFLSLLSLSVVICIISFFLPSHIRISRTIRIEKNSEAVMKELIDPSKWKNWYPGADTADFYYESGKIKGLVLKKDPWLVLKLDDVKEFEIIASYIKKTEDQKLLTVLNVFPDQDSSQVMVQWYMDFHPGWYPWKKFASLMYEKTYSPVIDKGLSNLKTRVEEK